MEEGDEEYGLLTERRGGFGTVRVVGGDGGDEGGLVIGGGKVGALSVEVVKRTDDVRALRAARRWVVERTFVGSAFLLLCCDTRMCVL